MDRRPDIVFFMSTIERRLQNEKETLDIMWEPARSKCRTCERTTRLDLFI